MRQEDAAYSLGMSLTSLKTCCRKLGLARWPYARGYTDLVTPPATVEEGEGSQGTDRQAASCEPNAEASGEEEGLRQSGSRGRSGGQLSEAASYDGEDEDVDEELPKEIGMPRPLKGDESEEEGLGEGWEPLEGSWIAWYMTRPDSDGEQDVWAIGE
ncbi:hypothetical protein GUITHDRAFT_104604 [Guillardia theta CCMP2712]|uniref:RWP-RK domain-containing protein n=1 Tax=Guillardia theta (strain CCMP2712) TaxID=905079 RepID=L1JNI7_GUITC|nr:hypothetical protein GUITHDRAFT_104604 [Guillardia theta CCMP2712]EKX49643.1 hypothetical protein GUITHDRAFT_104604 [Guillardia theta CCMP2712]|eukprot:XP_005836623.1 hypothetical protein GUITHDRAFT_104604 [Guillardia theta CCMP2712]